MKKREEGTDRPDPNYKGMISATGKVVMVNQADISAVGKNRRVVTPMRYATPDRSMIC